jgi:hypothetical protein
VEDGDDDEGKTDDFIEGGDNKHFDNGGVA